MAAMTITDIYFALSQMAVGPVPCRNREEIQLVVRAEDCPVRLLVPMIETEMDFMGIGKTTVAQHQIRDLCLWQPVTAGLGIQQCAYDMGVWCEMYDAALRVLKNPTAGSTIRHLSRKEVEANWGGTKFYGIENILTIEEYDP
jgi:hypothetical protein